MSQWMHNGATNTPLGPPLGQRSVAPSTFFLRDPFFEQSNRGKRKFPGTLRAGLRGAVP